MIFLMSCCRNADVAANMAVVAPIMEHNVENRGVFIILETRMRINTPATTIVDL